MDHFIARNFLPFFRPPIKFYIPIRYLILSVLGNRRLEIHRDGVGSIIFVDIHVGLRYGHGAHYMPGAGTLRHSETD